MASPHDDDPVMLACWHRGTLTTDERVYTMSAGIFAKTQNWTSKFFVALFGLTWGRSDSSSYCQSVQQLCLLLFFIDAKIEYILLLGVFSCLPCFVLSMRHISNAPTNKYTQFRFRSQAYFIQKTFVVFDVDSRSRCRGPGAVSLAVIG